MKIDPVSVVAGQVLHMNMNLVTSLRKKSTDKYMKKRDLIFCVH